MVRSSRPKVKIGISLDADLYEWLRSNSGAGGEFASVSHAIERSVARYHAETLAAKRDDPGRPPPSSL